MEWLIYQTCGDWRWEQVGARSERIAASRQGFATREECEADARRHGYAGERVAPLDQADDSAIVE